MTWDWPQAITAITAFAAFTIVAVFLIRGGKWW